MVEWWNRSNKQKVWARWIRWNGRISELVKSVKYQNRIRKKSEKYVSSRIWNRRVGRIILPLYLQPKQNNSFLLFFITHRSRVARFRLSPTFLVSLRNVELRTSLLFSMSIRACVCVYMYSGGFSLLFPVFIFFSTTVFLYLTVSLHLLFFPSVHVPFNLQPFSFNHFESSVSIHIYIIFLHLQFVYRVFFLKCHILGQNGHVGTFLGQNTRF